ncbi:WYL domain-containing protein [Acetobacterium fimetarium]|uniref:WYL domain-containing protein n=1 Tax=Acetobacterium fimetarium TaxID=52691 RepID=A0ABR6WTZ8_9FIRM|nr:WYL domain-containing protein [Acetobacterium fimetarium]MBC3804051.1 WYL domain-containing protein [Acetobacterium fimetarium]
MAKKKARVEEKPAAKKQKGRQSGIAQSDSVILALATLEVLKDETDKESPLTQNQILRLLKEKSVKCTAKTLSSTLKKLTWALNPPVYTEEDKDYFRIVYSGYDRELEEDDDTKENSRYMSNFYYAHDFSYQEIDRLIEGIQFSKTLTTDEANKIIEKIKKLTNRHYSNITSQIYTVPEFATAPQEQLKENLKTMQTAIADQVKMTFVFNGYDKNKQLVPIREKRYTVSPYYVVAYNGKYYLLANTDYFDNVSIYRVDLMSAIEIPERNEKNGNKGIDAKKMSEVKGLKEKWDPDDFMLKHLNMFYDEPQTITLKVRNNRYTMVHDWFGDRYTTVKKRAQNLDEQHDLIRVCCSPNAIINWALQYSNDVEVVEPVEIRNAIVQRLKDTLAKYDL